MDDLTGFVLAGGRSTRMGDDKPFLDWHGRPLIEHALQLAASVAGLVRIVGPQDKFGGYRDVVEDTYADCGPLAGIHAALLASTTQLNLVLAVDMPLVRPEFLMYMTEAARNASLPVTAPRMNGIWQPLCAVYRREFAAWAEAALKARRNKVDALFAEGAVRIINEHELESLGFPPAMFDNLNTPVDLAQARARKT